MNTEAASTVPGNRLRRVIMAGGGFGGLNAAKVLSNEAVEVTPIDRKNHHTFQPLLYQVALAVLSPGEIASPRALAGLRYAKRTLKEENKKK